MGCETKLWLEVLFFSVTCMQFCVLGVPQVPCHFIFGDSLSDCGNNNGLSTKAKVNYLPYGIDFPAGPTGRFTNGLTEADFITQLLGLKNLIPPFANLSSSDILEGVNYASGSAGIRNETGTRLGENFSLVKQVQNHRVIASQIATKLGSIDKAQQHLNKCLYYMNIGSNDYINNYEQPDYYPSQSLFTPEQYAAVLIQQYSVQLRALYAIGARRFALIGMMRLGCTPREISIHGKNGTLCVEEDNDYSLLFNSNLRTLVDRFNRELFGAKFILINTAAIATGDENYYCCKVDDKIGLCLPNSVPCNDRSQFKFFDAVHPSEKTNQVTAMNAYKSPSPAYAYPMDINQLVSI
ncbi:PREDICTED: GDSL esterase/lipase At5g45670-like [Lupinus angustifolius]|uniref:GDSL esterase/lipase At5g45670-like n=1 Tax=Lupinus angustifolius TaxID=3871 RepID=UPI00092F7D7B|nr:PREDICTED: GDSL esterase/lipase At5g45670-like [Lupinus angustifolius]